MEGAGEIVALGADVSDFEPGDRVAYCIAWGSYAEYAAVPASRVVNVPDALSLDMAAASVFHGFTAHYLAHDVGRLGPDVTCLVHAASGGIGQILIQLAKRLGATVFATTSTQGKAEVARERGADFAVLYENGGFADAIRAATQGRGVDVVFDSIGKATLRDSLRATRKKGLVVAYGSVSGSVNDLDPIELGEAGSLFSHARGWPIICRTRRRRAGAPTRYSRRCSTAACRFRSRDATRSMTSRRRTPRWRSGA